MKKRMLKSWVVKVLGVVVVSYFFFLMTTIENIGNSIYNTIILIWTPLAFASFYLLVKYSKVFED